MKGQLSKQPVEWIDALGASLLIWVNRAIDIEDDVRNR